MMLMIVMSLDDDLDDDVDDGVDDDDDDVAPITLAEKSSAAFHRGE